VVKKSMCEDQGRQAKLLEMEGNWKRALADYQNLQKRTAEERLTIASFANAALLTRLLPVLDNLEKVVLYVNDSGLKLTVKEFTRVLSEEGIEEFAVLGDDFDPAAMEALETVPGEEGKVVEVINKGYRFKGKILRPAGVKVGQKEVTNNE